MDNKIVALAFIVCVAAVATAVIYVKSQQPAQGVQQPVQGGDVFSATDNWLKDLDNFLGSENQELDYDLENILGDWG
jgi:uncharacterized membrane protein